MTAASRVMTAASKRLAAEIEALGSQIEILQARRDDLLRELVHETFGNPSRESSES